MILLYTCVVPQWYHSFHVFKCVSFRSRFDGLEFMAERDEFLPGMRPGIKAPQFTDVSAQP